MRLLLITALCTALPSFSIADGTLDIVPNQMVTPERAATIGCIEGEDAATGDALSVLEQIEACNTHVILTDNVHSRYYRALFLFEHGITDDHFSIAINDFGAAIEAGVGLPTAHANRGWLLLRERGDSAAALEDLNQAIALTQTRPRARYFERRAVIRLAMVEANPDAALVMAAQQDLTRALELNPGDPRLVRMQALAGQILSWLAEQEGLATDRG